MDVNEYRVKLVQASIINMDGAYGNVSNPAIYDKFSSFMAGRDITHVWDAFANRHGDCIQFFTNRGVKVISHNVDPSHPGVLKKDSTREGPGGWVGAVILHPPYFGSCPLSSADGELSLLKSKDDYFRGLRATIQLVLGCLQERGYVCCVGRSYRTGGELIRLDEWWVEEFSGLGFELVEVWKSVPDVAIVIRRK